MTFAHVVAHVAREGNPVGVSLARNAFERRGFRGFATLARIPFAGRCTPVVALPCIVALVWMRRECTKCFERPDGARAPQGLRRNIHTGEVYHVGSTSAQACFWKPRIA